ncbi:glycosyltransferase [uncultured Rubinisphaera sp.]|uniref:glycosyltransferase n=1 Tax=uncultured Rubinisphaera sp. TaxID=1678686 RepID=UPI0030D7C8AB
MGKPVGFARFWNQVRFFYKQSPLQKYGKQIENFFRKMRKRKPGSAEEFVWNVPIPTEMNPQNALDYAARLHLNAFLTSSSQLVFPTSENPAVSIILVLYNRAELTFQCLQSILASVKTSMEVVIYDNGSNDLTNSLLDRLENVVVIRGKENIGYVQAVNRAAEASQGTYLLLLNNDTQLISGAIETGIEDLESDPTIGGVGARLILPDGLLQEAGSIIWSDGSTQGYCRGKSAEHYEAMFLRTVDYCSAAFWLMRRNVFEQFGGFDEGFSPAYYEEVDLCSRMNQAGLRQVYDPRIVVLHYEFASSKSADAAIKLQVAHRTRFVSRNQNYLSQQFSKAPGNILAARTTHQRNRRILMIEDRIPHPELGSGFPRSNLMLHCLVELGYEVTLFAAVNFKENWNTAYRDIPHSVEIVQGQDAPSIADFLIERQNHYRAVIISRPHNMENINHILTNRPDLLSGTKLVYDAEAIFSIREIERLRLAGVNVSEQKRLEMLNAELQIAEKADSILAVSEGEAQLFRDLGKEVHVLSHAIPKPAYKPEISSRQGLLFVGAVHDVGSPNAKSLVWLCEEILPAIKAQSGRFPSMTIAGMMLEQTQAYCRTKQCNVLGRVDDLSEVYQSARVFVAPTQFAAGIPLKIIEAAAHGVPVVATSVLANQLGWTHGCELLVADSPEEFAVCCLKLQQNDTLWSNIQNEALRAVERDYSKSAILKSLQLVLTDVSEKSVENRVVKVA